MSDGLTLKSIQQTIRESLSKNDKALIKGLTIIYSHQTRDEQQSERTIYDNGVGFTGVDADFLSSLYRSYQKYGSLSIKQLNILRRCMPKYSGQLMRHAIDVGVYELIPGTRKYRKVSQPVPTSPVQEVAT